MEQPIYSGRELPHNLEAEIAVLGSVIMEGEAIGTVVEHLRSQDFYLQTHQTIFDAMIELFNTATPIDVVTLSEKLGGSLDAIGGVKYLAHLAQSVTTTANIGTYIKIVEGNSLERKLIAASKEISDMCYEQKNEPNEILDAAEQRIFEIGQKRNSSGLTHIRESIVDSMSRVDAVRAAGGKITGVPTGFTALDNLTAGLHNGNLVLIAARPAMGKTAFAMNIAVHAAVEHKVPVAVFNMEMSKLEVVNRILCSEALVLSDHLKTGSLDQKDIERLAQAIGRLSASPLYIDDTPGMTVESIRAKCRKMKMQNKLGLVVIDYLQLMKSSKKTNNRVEEVADISRGLKILAKELEVPVIALSQLSRGPESRTDHRPMMSDLRESGSIEQDADMVMLLYREDYYNPETEEQNIAECNLAKHRSGAVDKIKLAWRAEYTKFMNLDTKH